MPVGIPGAAGRGVVVAPGAAAPSAPRIYGAAALVAARASDLLPRHGGAVRASAPASSATAPRLIRSAPMAALQEAARAERSRRVRQVTVAGPFHIACYGNSLTAGWSAGDSYPGELATLRPADDVVNIGTANQYEDQMRSNFVSDVVTPYAGTPKRRVCVWWEAIDQFHDHGAITAAQLLTKIQQARDLCQANGILFVTGTIMANKDPPATIPGDQVFNDLLRANLTGINGFFDPWTNPNLTDPDNATYFQDAGSSVSVHLKLGGIYGAELAPLVHAALNAMVP